MSMTLDGTNGSGVPVVTTTQKNALAPVVGYLVFDSTLGKLCVYTGSVWQTVTST